MGIQRCNLGGVEGTLDDGLSVFKGNFPIQIEEMIGEFDLPVMPVLAWNAGSGYRLDQSGAAMEGEDMLRLIEHEQSQPFDAFAASGKIPHYTKTHFYGELCRRKGIEVQRSPPAMKRMKLWRQP